MVKRLVFDLTKIPFLKCLTRTYSLIVEVNDQNFLQNRIWVIDFRVMSSFMQVYISQKELKLLGKMESESP